MHVDRLRGRVLRFGWFVMQLWVHHNLMRPSRLRRGIAIFFLAFTFVDLTLIDIVSAKPCNDELTGQATGNQASSFGVRVSEVSAISTDSPHQQQPSQPDLEQEDCFCCCAHVIPSVSVTAPPLCSQVKVKEASIASMPSSPPNNPYHPPRLS